MLLVILQMVNQANIEAETSYLLNISRKDPLRYSKPKLNEKEGRLVLIFQSILNG